MRREDLSDLAVFLAVAEARSFTKAAARLGTSQSALSHTVRRLEARMGIRLLARTTRSVAPTPEGERLLATVVPAFASIDQEVTALGALRASPAGTVRITAVEHAANTVLWPVLETFLPAYPDIKVELTVDYGLTNIVREGFDAGVRLGEMVERDMIAVRIGSDQRMAVVGAPSYFGAHPTPRRPEDLAQHVCINLRLPTLGGLYSWEFEKSGRALNVRVGGQLVFNNTDLVIRAAVAGLGLGYVPEDQVEARITDGSLVRMLTSWCPPFSGYHLYYPSRRQQSPAFALLIDALRAGCAET